MDWLAVLLKIMNWIQLVVPTCLGSMGILALYASFYIPDCGIDAILMLSSATVMTLAVPKPQKPVHRGRVFAGHSASKPGFVARLREAVGSFRSRW
jgi:hypothetical protein